MTEKLTEIFKKVDAILVSSPENVRYLSNFAGEGYLILSPKIKILLTDSRYTEDAKNSAKEFEVLDFGKIGLKKSVQKLVNEHKFSTLGFEDEFLRYAGFQRFQAGMLTKFVGISQDLSLIRIIKEEFEIENIKKAQKISEVALSQILPIIKPGITELEIAIELDYAMRKLGSERPSFDTIVVSGPNGSKPHGVPSNKKIVNGDFVTIDFGAVFHGYSSDMTRTFAVGHVSDEQKKIYETVLAAQMAALNIISEGVVASDADKAGRDIINDAGFGKYFGHSLGHGVGLLIHELPNLSPSSQTILKRDMIATVEPGIYVPEFCGVRIEDMVRVNENGCENLTEFPKKLVEL